MIYTICFHKYMYMNHRHTSTAIWHRWKQELPFLFASSHQERLLVDAMDENLVHHGIASVFQQEEDYVGNLLWENHSVRGQVWAGEFHHIRINAAWRDGVDTDIIPITFGGQALGEAQQGVF